MSYEQAQHHIQNAERHLRSGNVGDARLSFLDAARLEWQHVLALPPDRVRSRSVFGLSAASHLFQAHALDEAERVVHQLLGMERLDSYCQYQLRTLLSRIWNERLMDRLDLQLSESALSVVLRGGEVGEGLAPHEVVDAKVKSAWNLTRRMAAWKNGIPIEQNPVSSLVESYRAWLGEPVPGSYRVDLYLASSKQLTLSLEDERPPATAEEVIESVLAFAGDSADPKPERLVEMVPDEAYRTTMVRLVRNLLPDGERVRELELRRGGQPKEAAVLLSAEQREPVNRLLQQFETAKVQSPAPGGQPTLLAEAPEHLDGVLRAVDLDSHKLRLDHTDGRKTPLTMPSNILDDVVGPMLNQRVRVTRQRIPKKRTWIVRDVELL